ncbi:MAG: ABC transporter permease subunit [Proteobacteria bacterium]|uniref:molybdate ABC transporter permease subunit n=1 Tax=Aquabacterium sp. TaxID=1872578 RepID=UPI0035C772ED|nr:ABC transporter permease subunit [Pseudomonadota bacterium]
MSAADIQAIGLSLRVAVLTVLIATPVSVVLASLMARTHWHGKWLLDTLILLPMGLPPAVIGFALLVGLGAEGALGAWLQASLGWHLSFYPSGAVLAACLMTVPLMVRLLRPAFEATDPMLLPVARSLGASRWQAWRTVSLPMAAPAVASAMALGLAAAWGESGATLVLAAALQGPAATEPTAPVALVRALQQPGGMATAWHLAGASLGVALLAVAASEWARARWRRIWQTRLQQPAAALRP